MSDQIIKNGIKVGDTIVSSDGLDKFRIASIHVAVSGHLKATTWLKYTIMMATGEKIQEENSVENFLKNYFS